MSFFLRQPVDFQRHNEEVRRVMAAFDSRKPYRVPVWIVGSITNYLLNPALNVNGWSFRDYFENPEIHVKAQLEYQKWQKFNLVCDGTAVGGGTPVMEMGVPERGWPLLVDFQNSYDEGWMDCELRYFDGGVPDTIGLLQEHKERLYDLPKPLSPTHGLLGRALEFYEYMHEACERLEYEGKPVIPPARILGEYNDGPLDLAYKLRGAGNLLLDMMTDPGYYHDLMDYVTTSFIHRMKKLRELRWSKLPDSPDRGVYREPNFPFADDALALISLAHYKEFVYPYHKRILDEFSDGTGVRIHLCGDATRHFKFLKDMFNVTSFDTGFPVDHGKLREELGTEVLIQGGPTVMLLKDGGEPEIAREVKRICESGVMNGGRFIMIAANNLAPCTPLEHIQALYEATKRYGMYM